MIARIVTVILSPIPPSHPHASPNYGCGAVWPFRPKHAPDAVFRIKNELDDVLSRKHAPEAIFRVRKKLEAVLRSEEVLGAVFRARNYLMVVFGPKDAVLFDKNTRILSGKATIITKTAIFSQKNYKCCPQKTVVFGQ